jgi:hypothetical protein
MTHTQAVEISAAPAEKDSWDGWAVAGAAQVY